MIPRPLTPTQARVFAVISHYFESIGEPAGPSYIARKSGVTRQNVYGYLDVLHAKGWLAERTVAIPRVRGPLVHRS